MKRLWKLNLIGTVAGITLMALLKVMQMLTGSQAYVLLFNTGYIPVLPDWGPEDFGGIAFHFVFCIVSVIALFYILKMFHLQHSISMYLLIYTAGSAILYSLTGLADRPPALNDFAAWTYWTMTHAVYGLVVGWVIKYWMA
ncbi:hypothetical protein [Lentibacillus sp. CBA3610]|uniref:hypothetical protein n=1 Tax=Lentibacillus sp. CBA3610 TaxID=2518176 RepID=UPI00159600E9|nr:hypothetical protein [Lentibacillus sp. CBA3610]QKY70111.1 hypothetical protein Len3610_11380 [Lentibacillus sp. CBA3610]